MFDFRLKVFYAVAKRLNFTKAAGELYISQPAVTKHIKGLEESYQTALFERSGNSKIKLTPAGEVLLSYTGKLLTIHRELEFEMSLGKSKHTGALRIGASTTIAQYLLPAMLADFRQKFKGVRVSMISGNTEEIEQILINKEIEIGFIEGISKNPMINYMPYLQDQIVLVCPDHFSKFKKERINMEELRNCPLLMREPGSGTLEVIAHHLKPFGIKLNDLNIEMQLGSTEGIKSYLAKSDCLAFISVHAIVRELKNRELRIVDIEGFNIERPLQIVHPYGQPSNLAELLIRFAGKQHNLLKESC